MSRGLWKCSSISLTGWTAHYDFFVFAVLRHVNMMNYDSVFVYWPVEFRVSGASTETLSAGGLSADTGWW